MAAKVRARVCVFVYAAKEEKAAKAEKGLKVYHIARGFIPAGGKSITRVEIRGNSRSSRKFYFYF